MKKSLSSEFTSPFGHLYKNWPLVKFKDITLKIGSGATPRGGSRVYLSKRKNAALIRSQNVFDRYFDNTGLAFISDDHAEQLSSVAVLPDDVLLNITGDGITYGRACMVGEDVLPAYVNQHVAIIRPNPNLCSSGYLLSYLTHPQIKVYMESFNAGGSRRAITKGHIESFEIPLPPLPTQRRIAQILGRLDDKIEVNRRINRTLEAMAEAFYKHWFVDFGPFQDGPFVESDLGLIPEGWEVAELGDHITATKGLSYKGKWLADDGLPMHNLNSIFEGGGYKYEGIKFYTGEYKERHIVKPGDIIVANTEQGFEYLLIGCPAIIPKRFGDFGIFSHHIFKIDIIDKSPLSTYFIYLSFKQEAFRQAVTAHTNGTTVNMLSRDGLTYPKIIIPPRKVIQAFDKVVEPMIAKIEVHEDENVKLAEIRDYLLPKLLSGEINLEP